MKIKELLKEFDSGQVDIGRDVSSDFKKGAAAVNKILDPKQWFGGSDASANARVKKQLSNVEVRDALKAAASGKLYQSDIGALKQIINNVKNGTYKAANPKSVSNSLNAVINGGSLSKDQAQELLQLSQSF